MSGGLGQMGRREEGGGLDPTTPPAAWEIPTREKKMLLNAIVYGLAFMLVEYYLPVLIFSW